LEATDFGVDSNGLSPANLWGNPRDTQHLSHPTVFLRQIKRELGVKAPVKTVILFPV
jgi:hypothetical protein